MCNLSVESMKPVLQELHMIYKKCSELFSDIMWLSIDKSGVSVSTGSMDYFPVGVSSEALFSIVDGLCLGIRKVVCLVDSEDSESWSVCGDVLNVYELQI